MALVTGASSGIGDATGRRLAEHGASVVVARRKDRLDTLAAEIEAAGGTALAVEADITDRDQADRTVQSAVARFGRLDILINNARLMLLGPVVGADVAEWERMMACELAGIHLGAGRRPRPTAGVWRLPDHERDLSAAAAMRTGAAGIRSPDPLGVVESAHSSVVGCATGRASGVVFQRREVDADGFPLRRVGWIAASEMGACCPGAAAGDTRGPVAECHHVTTG